MDFDSMKYGKLQKLAKKAGIKANMKADKLVKALKDYYRDNSEDASSTDDTDLGIPQELVSAGLARRTRSTESEDPMTDSMRKVADSSTTADATLPQGEMMSGSHAQGDMPDLRIPSALQQGAAGQQKRPWGQAPLEGALTVQVTPSPGSAATTPPRKQQRQGAFNVEKSTLGQCGTPEAGSVVEKQETSPSTQAVLNSISGDMNSEERRTKLMNAINKKVEQSMERAPPTSHIPRFADFLAQRRPKKVVTPGNKDWEKVHKKAFAKFDSIDVYLEKRRKRTEELSASVKKARGVLQEVHEAVTKIKSRKKSSVGKADNQPFKPSVLYTKDMNLNFSDTASESKRPSVAQAFKPTVVSTKSMNLNFAAFRSPACRSAVKCTPQLPAQTERISCLQSAGAKSGARKSLSTSVSQATDTPFHFTGNKTTVRSLNNTTLVKSASKTFDLQASLARPITWKPHTGKLPPLETGCCSSGASGSKSTRKPVGRHEELYKIHRNQSSDARCKAVAANRMKQKSITLMKRRGVVL